MKILEILLCRPESLIHSHTELLEFIAITFHMNVEHYKGNVI